MMRKGFTLVLQKHPLKNVLATTRGTSNTPNTETVLSYQTMYGNSNIYHQLFNGALLQRCYQKHNKIFLNLSFCEILHNKVIE